MQRRHGGFTLIEVIIVVVIVGILMGIALPAYQDSMRKGRRADAKAGLMDAANRQEAFMLDRSRYTEKMSDLGFSNVELGDNVPVLSEEKHYNIFVEVPVDPNCPIANCYVLTATPVSGGAQADDEACASLSIDSTGARTATGTMASECW